MESHRGLLAQAGSIASLNAQLRRVVGYPSGQRGQTVNLLAYAFDGSNPSPTTTAFLRREQIHIMACADYVRIVLAISFTSRPYGAYGALRGGFYKHLTSPGSRMGHLNPPGFLVGDGSNQTGFWADHDSDNGYGGPVTCPWIPTGFPPGL